MNKPKVIVFDVDGTLADIEHRRAFVRSKPKNWPAFNRAMVNDLPHDDIIWLYKMLAAQADTIMLIASGRNVDDKDVTEAWLALYGVEYKQIYMRPSKDYRADNLIKREILDQITADWGVPYMVFDDRNQVVDMWREAGVRCVQVAPGDF